jgi:hypothetical protein
MMEVRRMVFITLLIFCYFIEFISCNNLNRNLQNEDVEKRFSLLRRSLFYNSRVKRYGNYYGGGGMILRFTHPSFLAHLHNPHFGPYTFVHGGEGAAQKWRLGAAQVRFKRSRGGRGQFSRRVREERSRPMVQIRGEASPTLKGGAKVGSSRKFFKFF